MNFWGVTFADDTRFYATLATGGRTYLVQGDAAAHTVRTIHGNVECPSLSPDGTRVAYKKRVQGHLPYRSQVQETIVPGSDPRPTAQGRHGG